MRIFAAFLLLVSFAVISDAAANELQNGGSILTPCGKYIPGKIEFCKKNYSKSSIHPNLSIILYSKVQSNVFGVQYSRI